MRVLFNPSETTDLAAALRGAFCAAQTLDFISAELALHREYDTKIDSANKRRTELSQGSIHGPTALLSRGGPN